ncbi:hypothetical protein L1887_09046 [Cichorium endivia]|nr:hypothetical protein L1887_09046 [Cichorium endivia]
MLRRRWMEGVSRDHHPPKDRDDNGSVEYQGPQFSFPFQNPPHYPRCCNIRLLLRKIHQTWNFQAPSNSYSTNVLGCDSPSHGQLSSAFQFLYSVN